MIRIYRYGGIENDAIFERAKMPGGLEQTVADILSAVRERGDEALKEFSKKFDRAELSSIEVSPEEIDAAYAACDPELIRVIERSAENIRVFHRNQQRSGFIETARDGVVTGQRVLPLEKAGLYIPGGTAAYPSTVLMNAIPAKLAGVEEIVMVSPPSGGEIAPVILAAAKIAGVDRVFRVGGAQAVAALAYGTETVPKVDKIVGPGNAYVAEAKKQVSSFVGVDMVAGPSEILVIADGNSRPDVIAADLLSQAEHDKNASAVLVTTSEELAKAVQQELEVQIPLLLREEIARASIDHNGKIILCESIEKAIEVSNEIAPEHLELQLDAPFDWLGQVKNAGSVFLGRNCPEAAGDYYAGPNHTLPTMGTARFYSPLSVDDFVKKMQYTYYSESALRREAGDIARFAMSEGLTAHAKSALIRTEE